MGQKSAHHWLEYLIRRILKQESRREILRDWWKKRYIRRLTIQVYWKEYIMGGGVVTNRLVERILASQSKDKWEYRVVPPNEPVKLLRG